MSTTAAADEGSEIRDGSQEIDDNEQRGSDYLFNDDQRDSPVEIEHISPPYSPRGRLTRLTSTGPNKKRATDPATTPQAGEASSSSEQQGSESNTGSSDNTSNAASDSKKKADKKSKK